MLSIIVAKANNNVIGGNNELLWHLSKDLKRFKEITTGKTIIMGRKTFESLPKVLPNRHHVILTSNKNYTVDSDSVTVINNVKEIIEKYTSATEEAFIIGGGEIYNLLLPHTNKLYLTRIYKDFEGDTFFPNIDLSNWEVSYKSEIFSDEKEGLTYDFINLIRK